MCSSLVPTEHYLQSPLQLEHACGLILDSELFAFHSERMSEILTDEAAGVSPRPALLLLRGQRIYAESVRTQIPTLSSCCTVFCFTMDVAAQASSDHTNIGSL